MSILEPDEERRRLKSKKKLKWAGWMVRPLTLKVVLTTGPMVARALRLVIELVKLFRD